MTQNPGKLNTPGTDVVTQSSLPSHHRSGAKRIARVAAAGALSFGMMSVFAFPAYATPDQVAGQPDGFALAQKITTAEVEDVVLALEAPSFEIDSAEIERQEAEEAAQAAAEAAEEAAAQAAAEEEARREQEQRTAAAAAVQTTVELPPGAGSSGLLNAAVAQIGQYQDCTALVERALRAIGFSVGDLGTQVWEYAQYGTVVTDGSYAPGDILIWPGAHVAIYAGNGQAVHGGWGGNQTVIATAFGTFSGMPSAVVRIG